MAQLCSCLGVTIWFVSVESRKRRYAHILSGGGGVELVASAYVKSSMIVGVQFCFVVCGRYVSVG